MNASMRRALEQGWGTDRSPRRRGRPRRNQNDDTFGVDPEDVDPDSENESKEEEDENEDAQEQRRRRRAERLARQRTNDPGPSTLSPLQEALDLDHCVICVGHGSPYRCYSFCRYGRPHIPKHTPIGDTPEQLFNDIRTVKCPNPFRQRRVGRRFLTDEEKANFQEKGHIGKIAKKPFRREEPPKPKGPKTRYEILLAKG